MSLNPSNGDQQKRTRQPQYTQYTQYTKTYAPSTKSRLLNTPVCLQTIFAWPDGDSLSVGPANKTKHNQVKQGRSVEGELPLNPV
jgi:hypothetical protein